MQKVECGEHGEACAAYVCGHLVGASGLEWYSAEPIEHDRWPNAWCGRCHEAYVAAGEEWNERSENAAGVNVTLICHHCYERFRARCVVHYL